MSHTTTVSQSKPLNEIEALVATKFTTNRNAGIGPAIDRPLPPNIITKRAYQDIVELLIQLNANRTANMEAMVWEILRMANWESFVIHDIKRIAEKHGVTINK